MVFHVSRNYTKNVTSNTMKYTFGYLAPGMITIIKDMECIVATTSDIDNTKD